MQIEDFVPFIVVVGNPPRYRKSPNCHSQLHVLFELIPDMKLY